MKFFRPLTGWVIAGVCVTMAMPIITAFAMARLQAEQREERYISALARNALAPSEATVQQLAAGARLVNALPPGEACSDAALDLMRRIDLSSTLLQAVGRAEGDTMLCSSFSGARPVALGPASYTATTGTVVRNRFRLAGSQLDYLAVSMGRFVGVVHKALPLSFVDHVPGLIVGVFTTSNGQVLAARGGAVDPAWIDGSARGDRVFRSGGRLVAVTHSQGYDMAAVASLPLSQTAGFVRDAAIILAPLGALTGALLSAALIYVVRTRASMPGLIRQGLRSGEFHLNYQPVIDVDTGRMVGAEALLRWRRADGASVPPDVFIPVAEQAGLIGQLTARVLELLAEDMRPVLKNDPDFHFAVNFAAADMHRGEMVDEVGRFLKAAGAAPRNLIVEATERSLVDVELARCAMRRFRDMGVKVAIDDFGTGYSSLGYLAQLEVEVLKIDRLFVQALGTESATSQVAARIIDMAQDLNLRIIAEGVETAEQHALLRRMGVDFVQGYLHGRPDTIDALLQRLRGEIHAPAPAVPRADRAAA